MPPLWDENSLIIWAVGYTKINSIIYDEKGALYEFDIILFIRVCKFVRDVIIFHTWQLYCLISLFMNGSVYSIQ